MKIPDKHLATIQGALTDAFIEAFTKQWRASCREALIWSGFSKAQVLKLETEFPIKKKK
jgi:hypothetical protein